MNNTTWAAYFEVPDIREPSPDQAEAFRNYFPQTAGVAVAVGPGVSATFTIEAEDLSDAFGTAHQLFRDALEHAGLDQWASGRGEVVRADLADADLDRPNA